MSFIVIIYAYFIMCAIALYSKETTKMKKKFENAEIELVEIAESIVRTSGSLGGDTEEDEVEEAY